MLSLLRIQVCIQKNLKELNSVDDQIDKCMECGYCEPVCPSRNLSLTPRQRNTVARKIETLEGEQKTKMA